jgi:hypothetical protein
VPKRNAISGCPLGLEHLTEIDTIDCQKVKCFNSDYNKTNIQYNISNKDDQQMYCIVEDVDYYKKNWSFSNRVFSFKVLNSMSEEILRIKRESKLCANFCCSCWCADSHSDCSFEVVIETPVGQLIGYAKQSNSLWNNCFDILDKDRNIVIKIQKETCSIPFFKNDYKIVGYDAKTEIGAAIEEYPNIFSRIFQSSNKFKLICKF